MDTLTVLLHKRDDRSRLRHRYNTLAEMSILHFSVVAAARLQAGTPFLCTNLSLMSTSIKSLNILDCFKLSLDVCFSWDILIVNF